MKYLYYLLSFLLFTSVALTVYILMQIPTESELRGCLKASMFQVDLCPNSKNYTSLNLISKHLQKAVILSEDGHFWNHSGFDWVSLQETAEKNMKKGKIVRGGSTITQQLAKNLFLSQEKTYKRKFFEALITLKIESVLTKKEILERYLNVIEFGKEIYGVKKAAQFYFKKSPKDLDPVESAFLAMLLPNPKKYSSSFYKKELTRFAKGRISRIVGDMYRTGHLSESAYEVAKLRMQSLFGVVYKEEDLMIETDLIEGEKIIDNNINEVDQFSDKDLESQGLTSTVDEGAEKSLDDTKQIQSSERDSINLNSQEDSDVKETD